MKYHKPTTPGRRGMSRISYRRTTTTQNPQKSLTSGLMRKKGRNSGKISTRHKGGGHKRRYRDIDFSYTKKDVPARVASIEYDPNRSAYIGLLVYADGEKRYAVLPQSLRAGDTVLASERAPVRAGNRLPLSRIPIGTAVYNVEIKPGSGAKLARAAGGAAEVIAHDAGYTHLKLPSSEVRKVLATGWASVGNVSNPEHRLIRLGKAGRTRWLGIRPTVRGSAMNAVDHPHGGGEGRQGRGHRRARSKWGKPTGKGQRTRRSKKYSDALIVRRRKPKKRK